jgi:Dyp-type peroxidase family
MSNLETQDIQGIIITGYGHLQYSSYLFLRIDDPAKAKAWLAKIIPQVTNAVEWPTGPDGKIQKPEWALNIAFTCTGLAKLGLSPESVQSFSSEFVQGMTEEARSRRLGDTGESEPKNWEIGGPQTAEEEIHALLIVQAPKDELNRWCQEQRTLFESSGLREVTTQQGYLPFDDGVEHFGFADAISQPNIEGSPRKDADDQPCIKPGEFILGYPNEYELLPATPTVPTAADVHNNLKPTEQASTEPNKRQQKDFGRNGSYLVFRKLHQDVAGFRRYLRDNFSEPVERELVAAKFVGRWPSGAPLVLAPDKKDDKPELWNFPKNNNFSYAATDSQGYRCPLGAHIRRVNPRDSLGNPQESIRSVNRHRIVRRGALYGDKLPQETIEDDGKDRGVLFFCINADIQRQFEFIQQTWINNRKFSGLYNDKDPLLGDHDGSSYDMTIQREPVRQRLRGLPRFVSVKGGGYFFLPSISALYFLAGVKNPHS